jgi:hypothetical protein
MSDTMYVTPAQVLAAKLAVELSEEAGEVPDEALRAIANAQVVSNDQSSTSTEEAGGQVAPNITEEARLAERLLAEAARPQEAMRVDPARAAIQGMEAAITKVTSDAEMRELVRSAGAAEFGGVRRSGRTMHTLNLANHAMYEIYNIEAMRQRIVAEYPDIPGLAERLDAIVASMADTMRAAIMEIAIRAEGQEKTSSEVEKTSRARQRRRKTQDS